MPDDLTSTAPNGPAPTNRDHRIQALCLAGRCADGAERGKGRLYHAVLYSQIRALCRAKPGRHSAGWSSSIGADVTCPRCLALMAKAAQP